MQTPTSRAVALCPYCTFPLGDDEAVTRARSGARVHADCLALARAFGPEHGIAARTLAARLRRIEVAVAGLAEVPKPLWDELAELRDDVHELDKRVTAVHSRALRALSAKHPTRRESTDDTHDDAA